MRGGGGGGSTPAPPALGGQLVMMHHDQLLITSSSQGDRQSYIAGARHSFTVIQQQGDIWACNFSPISGCDVLSREAIIIN